MANVFHLQIISPAARVLDAPVSAVEIPGSEGDFGVLPGHSAFFSMLRPGVIRVTLADGNHLRFFAAAGYADVTQTSCTILSDHLQNVNEITPADAADALTSARTAIASAQDERQKQEAEKLLAAAEALSAAIAA